MIVIGVISIKKPQPCLQGTHGWRPFELLTHHSCVPVDSLTKKSTPEGQIFDVSLFVEYTLIDSMNMPYNKV